KAGLGVGLGRERRSPRPCNPSTPLNPNFYVFLAEEYSYFFAQEFFWHSIYPYIQNLCAGAILGLDDRMVQNKENP
ncbi:hypothetical protein VYH60_08925, partial [Streptococcus anginosus]|nr:hypothetical protein [Streptococcus anginosus]